MRLSLLLTFYPEGDFFKRALAPDFFDKQCWVFFWGGQMREEHLSKTQCNDIKDSVQTLDGFKTYRAEAHPPIGPQAKMGFSNGYANFLKDPLYDYVTGTRQNSYLMAFFGPLTLEDINTMFINNLAPFGVLRDHLHNNVDASTYLSPIGFTCHDLMHWRVSGETPEHHSLLKAIRALPETQTSRLSAPHNMQALLKETISKKELYEILFFLMHHELTSDDPSVFKAGNIFRLTLYAATPKCTSGCNPGGQPDPIHLIFLNNFARILSEKGYLRAPFPRLPSEAAKVAFPLMPGFEEKFDTLQAQGLIDSPLVYFTGESDLYPVLKDSLVHHFQRFEIWAKAAMASSIQPMDLSTQTDSPPQGDMPFSVAPYVGVYGGIKAVESADAMAYLWGKATGLPPPLYTETGWMSLKVLANYALTFGASNLAGVSEAQGMGLRAASAMYAITQCILL